MKGKNYCLVCIERNLRGIIEIKKWQMKLPFCHMNYEQRIFQILCHIMSFHCRFIGINKVIAAYVNPATLHAYMIKKSVYVCVIWGKCAHFLILRVSSINGEQINNPKKVVFLTWARYGLRFRGKYVKWARVGLFPLQAPKF